MKESLDALNKGLKIGAYYAGLVAPVAAVIVVASWFRSSKS